MEVALPPRWIASSVAGMSGKRSACETNAPVVAGSHGRRLTSKSSQSLDLAQRAAAAPRSWCIMRRILIIQGHPDPVPARLCCALAEAYAAGAVDAGHRVAWLNVAELDLPLLRLPEEFQTGTPSPAVLAAQAMLRDAEHWVLIYPIWLGGMPALFKGFLEQTLRPGFGFKPNAGLYGGLLTGRTARVIVTMGMPALVFRWWFGAASVKALRRNILNFGGIRPVRETLIGGVGELSPAKAAKHFVAMRALGAAAR
jgi:putative NADPH-quinone reductase